MKTLAFVELVTAQIGETILGFFPYGLIFAFILIGMSFLISWKRWFGCTLLLCVVLVVLNVLSGDITIK